MDKPTYEVLKLDEHRWGVMVRFSAPYRPNEVVLETTYYQLTRFLCERLNESGRVF